LCLDEGSVGCSVSRPGPVSSNLEHGQLVIVRSAARLLSDLVPDYPGDELFLAGLLEDVGILALGQVLREKAHGKVLDKIDHERLLAVEQDKFGVDQAQAGNWLLTCWLLPDFLLSASWDSGQHSVVCTCVDE